MTQTLNIFTWVAVAFVATTLPAQAREHPDARNTAIEATPYRLAPGNRAALSVDTAGTLRHLDFAASTHLRLERRPLGVIDTQTGAWLRSLVDYRDSLDIQAAFGLFGWLEISLGLPVTLTQDAYLPGKGLGAVQRFGLNDLSAGVKAVVYSTAEGVIVAADVPVTLPSGESGAWMGTDGVTAAPALLIGRSIDETSVTFRLAYRHAPDGQVFNLQTGRLLAPALGVKTGLSSLLPGLSVAAEATGGIPFTTDLMESPALGASWGVGAFYQFRRGYLVGLSGGGGLTETATAPGARVCLSLGYTHAFGTHPPDCSYPGAYKDDERCPPEDTDSDGVPDPTDACPDEPEDADGYQDEDGCPDDDNDQDGLKDRADQCPNDPEDRDGYQDEDGCPDPDNDKDGIPDGDDSCPDKPENHNGLEDDDGCPEADKDSDGILDADDRCPEEAEDKDGFEDDDGCPDVDNDGDGVPDTVDLCPMRPENKNGVRDEDGCPDEVLAVKTSKEIAITEEIYFLLGQVVPRRRSRKVLKAVVSVLQQHPNLHVRIEGHTDNYGGEDFNYYLSQARAQAIRDYIVRLGRPQDRLAERIKALGLGKQAPTGSNLTKEGRALNRRVRFVIVDEPKPE